MIYENKAQIQEIAFVLFTIISVAITMVIAAYVYYSMQPHLTTAATAANATNAITAYNKFGISFTIFDNSMLFIIIGLTIGLIITSFMIPTYPVFIVINIIGLLVLLFLSATFTNMYYNMGDIDPMLQNITQNTYPHTSSLIQYLPMICLIITAITTIVMYGKGKRENLGYG